MLNSGQQPGVPFRIAGSGPVRPQGERRKVPVVNNFIHLYKSSMMVTEENRKYFLQFQYDSTVDCQITVYVGAIDKTTHLKLR